MEKRNITISGMLVKYIATVLTLLLFTTIVLTIIWNVLLENHKIQSANTIEKEVDAWIENAKATKEFDLSTFPSGADYFLTDNDFQVISQSASADQNEGLKDFMEGYKTTNIGRKISGNKVYQVLISNQETLFIYYKVGVDNEWLIILALVLIYALEIVLPTFLLVIKIKNAINQVAEYAKSLGERNLDIQKKTTGIQELDMLSDSVDAMKNELVVTLESEWASQQQKKQEMAQIAHDLKTPLTIIRGNADLLLEEEKDPDKIESVNTIIKNAERIARSVLEILEK